MFSETNGVGAYPSEELAQRLPRARVAPVASTQASKEDGYGRLAALLSERSIVLPNDAELLGQLAGVSAATTPTGGLRIGARLESVHDDLPDAVSLAVGGLPRVLASVPVRDVPDGQRWAETPGGVRIPVPVALVRPEVSYRAVYGDLVQCAGCRMWFTAGRGSCSFCGAANPAGPLLEPVDTRVSTAEPVPVPVEVTGWAAAYLPDGALRCPRGHIYSGAGAAGCPACTGAAPAWSASCTCRVTGRGWCWQGPAR